MNWPSDSHDSYSVVIGLRARRPRARPTPKRIRRVPGTREVDARVSAAIARRAVSLRHRRRGKAGQGAAGSTASARRCHASERTGRRMPLGRSAPTPSASGRGPGERDCGEQIVTEIRASSEGPGGGAARGYNRAVSRRRVMRGCAAGRICTTAAVPTLRDLLKSRPRPAEGVLARLRPLSDRRTSASCRRGSRRARGHEARTPRRARQQPGGTTLYACGATRTRSSST